MTDRDAISMQVIQAKTFAEAQAIRSSKIKAREGVLILDGDHPGEPRHLIEKLMDGARFHGQPLDAIKWKQNPLVIVVGNGGVALLDQIEVIAPGFVDFVPAPPDDPDDQ